MSFQATPARSSRITKSRRPSAHAALGLRRATSSPSSVSPRKKSLPSESTISYDDEDQLDDTGVIASLAEDLNFRDVPQYMEYIRNNMFSDLPEKAGMNSARIADVLNYRVRLPPFVTIAHVDALSTSPTRIEREIAELAQAGILRRVTIPHRGVGAAAVGDGIASVREWQALVRSHHGLLEDIKSKYISVMDANPTSTTISGTAFTTAEISALVTVGFLTSTSAISSSSSFFASPGASSLAAVSTSGSRHAAGSLEAVGGASATQYIHGGTSLSGSRPSTTATYTFSLPNMGTHIKILAEARNNILNMLKKTKYKEMPLDVLRERWDGGVVATTEQSERKKLRGEFAGVLPGRTKKWKQFYGMKFEWILEECLGAGLVELFDTGSVGRADNQNMFAMAIPEITNAHQPDIDYTPDHEKYLARVKRRLATEKIDDSLPPAFPMKLDSDLVWDNTDIHSRFDWVYKLTALDLDEIETALQHFKSLDKPLSYVNQETFPLPTLHSTLRDFSKEIHNGFGFKVIRGLPVSRHTREEVIAIYAGIASHIASIRGRQDHQFEGIPANVVMNHIKDLSGTYDANKIGAPAYTADKPVFHTDSGDVITLLCLEEAAEGGQSKVSSSWRVYNELAEKRLDLIGTLAEDWLTEVYA
ncbi:hypothetical protein N0V83_004946 [Neocucurbitaria cava]|uniref:TauD/TfdA-like domain-containing protein n=1 Tax=Neocucurbitaria cava TaxID=798079 RepID=A0A9W8Y800_9PLEO|nr:hypothetical protein N0V83_004946 [Neocucurbitaria cava]